MSGHPIRVDENGANEDDLRAVAEIFREKGVENLIVTLGGNGSVAVNKNGAEHVACVKMPVVADTTAAGDSFVASFSTLWCAGLPARHHRIASRRDPEPSDACGGNGAAARARL